MLQLPVLRWGQPYHSLATDRVVHFDTGEEIAEFSQSDGMLIRRDRKLAGRARDALRSIPAKELVAMCEAAADVWLNDPLPIGGQEQSHFNRHRALADKYLKAQ